jgi:AGZA family xanthine/uracil permease-like MFS transporter
VLSVLLAAGFKLLLPHLPAAIAAAPDVTGSILVQRFALPAGVVSSPPSLGPTFFRIDLMHALSPKMIPFIFVFLFMLMFDAIGTLIGVCEQAGFMRDNKLPRARQAMISDAVGTVVGAGLGTSTVTSFIESAAGVEQGGRTGLTALVVAGLFLLAMFFSPLVAMAGSYPPITAPALVMVGAMMMRNATKIEWEDPAFITMIGIPLSYSIADGLALGFMADPIIKVCSGRGQKIGWLTYVLAAALLAYFIFIRSRMP